jgi:hypothetical protein
LYVAPAAFDKGVGAALLEESQRQMRLLGPVKC